MQSRSTHVDRENCVVNYFTGWAPLSQETVYFGAVDPKRITVRPHRGLYFIELRGNGETLRRSTFSDGRPPREENESAWVPAGGFAQKKDADKAMREIELLYAEFCKGR